MPYPQRERQSGIVPRFAGLSTRFCFGYACVSMKRCLVSFFALLLMAAAQAMDSQLIAVTPPASAGPGSWPLVELDGVRPFDEVVVSWEADAPAGSHVRFALRVGGQEFQMGKWSAGEGRTSIKTQELELGKVLTDTLVLKQPSENLSLIVTAQSGPDGRQPRIHRVYLNLTNGDPATSYAIPDALSPLPVPKRCQGDYPGGGVLCSPTSLSMVLAYWAQDLSRPVLDHDVPVVQAGVFDPEYGGHGNWPFNTAFAAQQPGMRGYVSRLRNLDDLAQWLGHGVPVVCSVAYGLLKGKPEREPNDGHLIVAVGFDDQGNILVNDPGRRDVRLAYPLRDFVRAWATSRNTVYLVHPEYWTVPEPAGGPWMP